MKLWLAAFAATWALGAHAGDADMTAWTPLKARIESGEIPGIYGVVVLVDGKTVVEWYFAGQDETIGERGPIALPRVAFDADTLHDVRSVTKSVVSILFGIAYSEGAIKDLDAPVFDYFPELADLRTPERMKVRVRDVLTMSSGLHWDERTYPYTDARNSEIAMNIGMRPWFGGRLMVSRAHTLFDASGELTDAALRKQLTEFMRGYVAFVEAHPVTQR